MPDEREWTVMERPGVPTGITPTRSKYDTQSYTRVVPKSRLEAAEATVEELSRKWAEANQEVADVECELERAESHATALGEALRGLIAALHEYGLVALALLVTVVEVRRKRRQREDDSNTTGESG